MSKKVYIGNGKYCYTENCSQHDTTEAGQLTIRANEAAIAGNITEFLKLKEEADTAAKNTGQKSETVLKFPSFSPDDTKSASNNPAPKPSPPKTIRPAVQLTEQQIAVQRSHREMIQSDIRSYSPNEKNFNGDGIVKFHKEIGFPKYFKAPKGSVALRYSRHALEATENDRYGRIPVLERADFDNLELIEIKYNQKTARIDRMLYRQRQGEDNVCIVISPGRDTWNVVTTWFNESGDDHYTLDRSKYSMPNSEDSIKARLSSAKKAA